LTDLVTAQQILGRHPLIEGLLNYPFSLKPIIKVASVLSSSLEIQGIRKSSDLRVIFVSTQQER
jgi:hypothetical protein